MLMAHAIDKLPNVIRTIVNGNDLQPIEETNAAEWQNALPLRTSKPDDTGNFVANEANIERVSLLDEIARASNINVIDRYINSNDSASAIFRFTDAYNHNQFNLSYAHDLITIGPHNSVMPLQNFSGTTLYFNWNTNTDQFEKGQRFEPSLEVIDSSGLEANYRYYGYIPEPRFQSPYYESLFPISVSGAFGEIDNQQIRLLYKNQNEEYPQKIDDGVSVIIKAKEFDVSNNSVSTLMQLQPDLELWNNVIRSDAKFQTDSSALSLTLTAGSGIFTSTPESLNKCSKDQQKQLSCFQASVITPHITTRYDKADLIRFSKEEAVTNLGALKQDSFDPYVPLMPVLLTKNGHYIVIVLSYDGRARFYRFDRASLENKEFNVLPNTGAKITFRSIKDSSPAGFNHYDGGRYTSFAESDWQRKQLLNQEQSIIDSYIVELPDQIRRIEPNLPKTLTLYGKNGKLYFGKLYQFGDVIEENRISVNESVFKQVIDAIDTTTLFNLYQNRN